MFHFLHSFIQFFYSNCNRKEKYFAEIFTPTMGQKGKRKCIECELRLKFMSIWRDGCAPMEFHCHSISMNHFTIQNIFDGFIFLSAIYLNQWIHQWIIKILFLLLLQAPVKKREHSNENTGESARTKRPRMERDPNWVLTQHQIFTHTHIHPQTYTFI